MTAASKPISTAAKPRYHSRLGIIVAKELGDFFLRSKAGAVLLLAAICFVPGIIAFLRTTDYGGSLDSYARTPYASDHELRSSLPLQFGVVAMFGPMMLASTFRNISGRSLLEPLLVSAARRWELAAGRLLTFAILWSGAGVIIAAMLAIVIHVRAVVAWCPFLGYFHPQFAFFAQFILVWTSTGCCAFAAIENMLWLPVNGVGKLMPLFFLTGGIAFWREAHAWPLAAFVPCLNAMNGVLAVFQWLPYDGRVEYRPHAVTVFWGQPHFWLLAVAGSVVTASLCTILSIRSFNNGEALANAEV